MLSALGVSAVIIGAAASLVFGCFKISTWIKGVSRSDPVQSLGDPYRTPGKPQKMKEKTKSLIEVLKEQKWKWDGDRNTPYFFLGWKFRVTTTALHVRIHFFKGWEEVSLTKKEFNDLYSYLKQKSEQEIIDRKEKLREKAEKQAASLRVKAEKIARNFQ